jgi:predicted small lipoprotein YifL
MSRLRLALLLALAACGSKSKGPPLAPLPPDSQNTAAQQPAPPEEPEPPPVPAGPIELTVAAVDTSVKLVNPGKGKRAPLKLTTQVGTKQEVEIALDFALSQSVTIDGQKQSDSDVVPTVVLAGDAEVTNIDGASTGYVVTITGTDARDVAGSKVPLDKFKPILASAVGLTLAGTVGANGATGEVKLKLDRPTEASAQVLELIALTMPPWPLFPTEPVGVGAKWQTTTKTKLAGRLDVTQITDYELVAYKNATWTIKGKTKITGADQMMQGGKISKITGTGAHEVSLVDGKLYPTQKASVDASFTASEAEPAPGAPAAAIDFQVKIGGAITAK